MASELTSRRGLGGELLAEFLGTMVLILFGDGVVAVVLLFLGFSGSQTGATSSWLLINFGWGFAVMLGVYVAGTISGAHLNPAVTVGLAVRGAFPWSKVGWFILFQVLGAWFAALLLFIEYKPVLRHWRASLALCAARSPARGKRASSSPARTRR